MAEIIEHSTFNLAEHQPELDMARPEVGTVLRFENDRLRVWEVRLEPGERAPFHQHVTAYFWTCVGPGTGRQRSGNGTVVVRRYSEGETEFFVHSLDAAKVHDLENVGDTVLRFVTVELLGDSHRPPAGDS